MLALRPIGKNDFAVIHDGNTVGRIRARRGAHKRRLALACHYPDSGWRALRQSRDLEPARAAFREAWLKFKAGTSPEDYAAAIELQDNARDKRKA